MTKEEIIEIIEKYQKESNDLILRDWKLSAIAYEILAKIKQENAALLKEFMEWLRKNYPELFN